MRQSISPVKCSPYTMPLTGKGSHLKDKKEVFISETSLFQFQLERPSFRVRSTSINNSSLLQNTYNIQNNLNQSYKEEYSKPKISQSASKTKSNSQNQSMMRLRLMKTEDVDEFSYMGQMSERQQPNLNIDIEKKNIKFTAKMQDPKWTECKIIGRNILTRSRAAVAIHQNHLYVYGGYELTSGCIGDFWKLNLGSDLYTWEKMKFKGKMQPGPKSRSSCCIFQDKMYLFGGQCGSQISSNELWCYDIKNEVWQLVIPQKPSAIIPKVDSHNSVLIGSSFFVLFGYFGEYSQLSNAVYEFNLISQVWTCRFKRTKDSGPKPRLESASTALQSKPNQIYSFGGNDGLNRLNDLWEFNLSSNTFTQIKPTSTEIPMVRSGHQLLRNDNQLILMGGIHSITWELDDLCVFDLNTQAWIFIDHDTSRTKEVLEKHQVTSNSKESEARKNPKSKKKIQTIISVCVNRKGTSQGSSASQTKKSFHKAGSEIQEEMIDQHDSKQSLSPGLPSPSKLEEKKRKMILAQKALMLSVFNVKNKQNEESNQDLSPTSEAMKNSLRMIGNTTRNMRPRMGRYDAGKVSVSRFLLPLNDQSSLRKGRRPCARDGHRAVAFGEDKIIVFGGDRHNMSFNDIYQLNLNQLEESINNKKGETNQNHDKIADNQQQGKINQEEQKKYN